MGARLRPKDQADGLRSAVRRTTVAITSGKGGVGKTSLAVNLALVLARAGCRTCLVDGDLGLANVDVLLNLHPRHSLRDVLLQGCAVDAAVMQGPAGLRILPAASGVEALANPTGPARRALAGVLAALERLAEVSIVDTGAGISDTVLRLVLAADHAVIVTTPEPTALTDAYAMLKVLTQRRPAAAVHAVVNLADGAAHAREVHERLDRVAQRFLGRPLPLLGWVPRDSCVERAVREQRPLALYFPYARATEAIHGVARALTRLTPAAEGFWARLLDSEDDALPLAGGTGWRS